LISDYPMDESSSLERVVDIDFENLDILKSDVNLWDAYPWLTPQGFRFILGCVARSSRECRVRDAMIIDAILDECSGLNQASESRDHWTDPFRPRWSTLKSSEIDVVGEWYDFLMESESNDFNAERITSSKRTLEWLREKDGDFVILV